MESTAGNVIYCCCGCCPFYIFTPISVFFQQFPGSDSSRSGYDASYHSVFFGHGVERNHPRHIKRLWRHAMAINHFCFRYDNTSADVSVFIYDIQTISSCYICQLSLRLGNYDYNAFDLLFYSKTSKRE